MAGIGIDFGTTNSIAVAYKKNEHQFYYLSKIGDKPTPISSTIWYHDNTIDVGNKARRNINKYAGIDGHHFEKSIKSYLGTGKNRYIFGKSVKPSEVASLVIQKIKEEANKWDVQNAEIDLSKAVFTIPINFNGLARNDLRCSANEAGIEVSTFIHEPFAAIIGYYFSKENYSSEKVISELKSFDGQYVLIFDWGGGTLDITVVKIYDGKMIELGTAELTGMAGDEFDKKIAEYIWNKFCDSLEDKYSLTHLNKCKREKWDLLLAEAERCKIELSTKERAEFFIGYAIDDLDIIEYVTRDTFNELISGSIDKAIEKISEAIKIADIDSQAINHVLLTGGTCYIPAVQTRMKQNFGYRVEMVSHPELVIAEGAAVIAEYGWLPFFTKDIQIELCDNSYWPIFESGMPIASGEQTESSETFTCVDQRNKIAKIIICEGIGQKKDKNLAVLNVPILGDYRFGDDVYVSASLDKDIILTVSANSKMVNGYNDEDEYSIRKKVQIHQLCFGLDFGG